MKRFIGTKQRRKDLKVLEEDTLSLSDLPDNNDDIDSEEWEKYYDRKSSNSSSSSDEEVFEFISSNKNAVPPENILFCGKLIPYRNPNEVKRPEKRWRSSRKFLGCPTEMELKDLKNRQNRKVASLSSSFKVGDGISDYRGKGILWSLIKALSCTPGDASYHAQTAVKASIGCISLV